MDLEYLKFPPTQNYKPGINGNLLELPLKEMTWENFERLCLTLVQEHSGFDVSDCEIFGTGGQKQDGIDIYAKNEISYYTFQCKRYKSIDTTKLEQILKEFETGSWFAKSEKFTLCITVDFADVKIQNKFEELKQYYLILGKTIDKWDFSVLNRILKNHPTIVYNFFGSDWCKLFCGEEVYNNSILKFAYEEFQLKLNKASSFLDTIKNYFEKKPLSHIERKETNEIFNWIKADLIFPNRNLLVVEGEKGIGKSVILKDLYKKLIENRYDVLAIKADKYYASSPKELENKLFFGDDFSFSKIIRFIKSKQKKLVVIIDQIDALSLTLSSNRQYIQTYNRLINELLDEKNIRIIISSRSFDLNYDADLSLYKSDKFKNINVAKLSVENVQDTFKLFNVNCNSDKVIELLRTPNHLEIFCKLPNKSKTNIDSLLTLKDLYDNLWSELITDNARQKDFLYILAYEMYKNQNITVPNKFQDYKDEVSFLKSNQLIIENNSELQFFHQTFYEYCFSRQFVEKGYVLKEFILENEQSLYVRSVIKMVIEYLREYNHQKYIKTLGEILKSNKFRFHIKSLIVTDIGLHEKPTLQEKELVNINILNNDLLQDVFASSINSRAWVLYLIEKDYFNKFLIINKDYKNEIYNFWHKLKLPNNSFIESFNIQQTKDNNINIAYRLIGGKINLAPIEITNYLDGIENFEQKENFIERVLINLEIWDEKELLNYFEKYIKYDCSGKNRENFWFFQILRKIFKNHKNYVIEKLEPILKDIFKDGSYHNELIHDIESLLDNLYDDEPDLIFQLIFKIFNDVIEENKYYANFKSFNPELYKCNKFVDEYSSINYADKKFEEYIVKHLKYKIKDREYFLAFFNEHKNSNSEIILRILICSFSTYFEQYLKEIHELLIIINNKKGFNGVDNIFQLELRKLIGLVFPKYNDELKGDIVKILLTIKHPYEIGFYKYNDGEKERVHFTGFGEKQLKFIKQLPISEINYFPELKKRYDELNRRFKNVNTNKASDVSSFGAHGISPPLLPSEYKNMTLKGWEKSMLKFNDLYVEDRWSYTGGKREHASEFKNVVKSNPEKFVDFIDSLFEIDGISISYLFSGVDGLIEASYNPIKVKELYKKLIACDLNSEYTLYAVWKSEYLINEKVLDLEILKFLCDCSLNHPNPEYNKIDNNKDPSFESLNTVRGAAIQRVISSHDYNEFEEIIFNTVEKSVKDERLSVKVAIIQKLAFLNNLNLERSFKIFHNLIENSNEELLKYSFWSAQYFNPKYHDKMGNYFKKILQCKNLHKDAFIITQNWIDEKINDKDTFEKFISLGKGAKLCAIRVAEGNLFRENETEMHIRCMDILKRFLSEKDEDFANAYSGLILRKFKAENFKQLYPFLHLYSKRILCKKEPSYFLQFLITCAKDYPIECLQLLKNMNFNKESRINQNGYYYDKEPVKLILAIYSKLNMDIEKNRKFVIQSLDVFDLMLTHSHLRTSVNSAIELIVL